MAHGQFSSFRSIEPSVIRKQGSIPFFPVARGSREQHPTFQPPGCLELVERLLGRSSSARSRDGRGELLAGNDERAPEN